MNREIVGKKILYVGLTTLLTLACVGLGLTLMNVRDNASALFGGVLILVALYCGGMLIWKMLETK